MNENGRIGSSPGCGSIFEKSTVRPSSRAGVPVLNRRSSKPRSRRFSVSGPAGTRPCGPPIHEHSPMMMRLFRYTPAQTIAARQEISAPVVVLTPDTRPFAVRISAISACRSSRFSHASTASRILRR